jgi:predicted outer membrane repeat protein
MVLDDRTLPSTFTVLNLADSGPGSLRAAIDVANANPGADIVRFAPALKGTITFTTGELSITDAVTIDGPGAARIAVSGDDASRVFHVTSPDVTMGGLTITHGLADHGGGIWVEFGAELTVAHAAFTHNEVMGGLPLGGGIYSSGELVVSASTFSNNVALFGGGISVDGPVATITHCTFTDNQATSSGGAIDSFGTPLVIAQCTFTGNHADEVGGAIDCFLFLDPQDIAFSNSTFDDNDARFGGAICGFDERNMSITNCAFTRNRAVSPGFAEGGAIAALGTSITVTNSRFSDNVAEGGIAQGGAISTSDPNERPSSISGSIFSGNEAIAGDGQFARGGAVCHQSPHLAIANSLFTGNAARGGDGGPSSDGGNALGGAVFAVGDPFYGGLDLTIDNSLFARNTAIGGTGGDNATGGNGRGGGLYISFDTTATMTNCAITGNRAIGGPGGIGGDGGDGQGGGLFCNDASTTTLRQAVVLGNVAQGGAGGVGGNGGDGHGGGIFVQQGSDVTLRKSLVTANFAKAGAAGEGGTAGDGIGGGFYIETGATARRDWWTVILGNWATTSHDNVFGDLVFI